MDTITETPRNLVPTKTGRYKITPEMATQIGARNTKNRPVSRRDVERLTRILQAGEWRENGEALKISKTGVLLDGQHRLLAIVESGISAEMLVVTGLDDSVFDTLDQGRRRTGGDVLFMRGIKRFNAASVACAALYRVLKNRPIFGSIDPIPTYGIDKIIDRHPGLIESLDHCAKLYAAGDPVVGLGYLTAFHYLVGGVLGEPEKAATLTIGLATGADLPADSPVLIFRKRVSEARKRRGTLHTQAKTALLAKAVGMHLTGQAVKSLTIPSTAASFESLIPPLHAAVAKLDDGPALRDLNY